MCVVMCAVRKNLEEIEKIIEKKKLIIYNIRCENIFIKFRMILL